MESGTVDSPQHQGNYRDEKHEDDLKAGAGKGLGNMRKPKVIGMELAHLHPWTNFCSGAGLLGGGQSGVVFCRC